MKHDNKKILKDDKSNEIIRDLFHVSIKNTI